MDVERGVCDIFIYLEEIDTKNFKIKSEVWLFSSSLNYFVADRKIFILN